MITNELKIQLDLEVFKKIYKIDSFFKSEGNIYRKDLLKEKKYNAIQSIFIRKNTIYILSLLKDEVDYQELTQVGYIQKKEEVSEDIIFTLLLNSLSKAKDSNAKLSNILGSLYYFVRKKGNNLIFLNINYYDKKLNLNVNTFTNKLDRTDSVRFILEGNRLRYPENGEKGDYIKKNYDEKSQVAFVSVKMEDYIRCKSMIAEEIISRMNQIFKEFLFVEFVSRDFESVKWNKAKEIKSKIEERINKYKINIINSTNEKTDIVSQDLRQLLLFNSRINLLEKNIEMSNTLKLKCLNINIVLPKEKYNDRDKYLISETTPIQNIYLDTLIEETKKSIEKEKYMSNVLEKILMELLFKLDIIEKKANLLEIYNIVVPRWKFFVTGYKANDGQKYKGSISVLDGNININFSKDDGERTKESYRIETEKKTIFCNFESNYYPLPNSKYLKQIMKENEKTACLKYDIVEIKEIIYKVIKNGDDMINFLNSYPRETIYPEELKKIFKLQKNRKAFSLVDKEYFVRNHMHIYNSPLTSENKEKIFNPCADINYYLTKDKNDTELIYYFVGKMEEVKKQNFAEGVSKWMPIKNVYNCSEEEFQIYLNLIKNDILSINKYSTKPVIFKYLIESIETYSKINAINKNN